MKENNKNLIYLNNAATSYPKPNVVKEAVINALDNITSVGRGAGNGTKNADNLLLRTRNIIAKFFNIDNHKRIIFTQNCTEALNYAIKGVLKKGDHVVMDNTAHNSLARPLITLEKESFITISKVNPKEDYYFDLKEIKSKINDKTKLVAFSHSSNVTGIIQDINAIGNIVKNTNALFLVDAAQTAGQIPIDVKAVSIDLLATAGHKSLFGPTGTGILYISDKATDLKTIKEGGTGSHSEFLTQPNELPFMFESGTHNIIGIAGLCKGIEYIVEVGLNKIREHEFELTKTFMDGIKDIKNIKIYGNNDASKLSSTVSITANSFNVSELGVILANSFNIITRAGLHCAPLAHSFLGTKDKGGTLRISPGYFNTISDIEITINSLKEILS